MDLLNDFDRARQTFSELGSLGQRLEPTLLADDGGGGVGGIGGAGGAMGLGGAGAGSLAAAYELPSLSVEASVRQAARGRGQVVAAACAADTVLLATSRGFLLRYSWDDYGNERVVETELPAPSARAPDVRVRALFLDPTGTHALVATRSSAGGGSAAAPAHELLYLHSAWAKPRPLAKLKGVAVTAVGWQRQAAEADGGGGGGAGGRGGGGRGGGGDGGEGALLEHSTGEVLLGTDHGALHVTVQEERSKREGLSALLLDPKDRRRAVCSVSQELLPGNRRAVFVATPSALYVAVGGPGLQGALGRYGAGGGGGGAQQQQQRWEPLIEVATPSLHSQLRLFGRGPDAAALPTRFAWLVGGSLLHGHLLLAPQQASAAANGAGAAAAPASSAGGGREGGGGGRTADAQGGAAAALAGAGGADGSDVVADMRQLQLAPGGAYASHEDEPRALAVTEYHYLLLYADRLVAINQVSGRAAAELSWGPGAPHCAGLVGAPLGLLQADGGDAAAAAAAHLWSAEALHEVSLANEGRDMWRTYLDHGDYANALKLAAGAAQRDAVYQAMGADAAAAGDWAAAGQRYGRIVGGRPPFEELALLLVESGDPEALVAFLKTKLQVLGPSDKAQATMAAAWLTELLLDSINRDLLAAGGAATPAYEAHVEQLRAFLVQHAAALNWNTTTALLESYGRLEELEVFAGAKGDQEALLEYLMRRPGGAARALGVLRKPSVGPPLVYRFAPELLAAAPAEAADFLIAKGRALDPRQLLPALVRFGEPGTPRAAREHALRYVAFAMDRLRCEDAAVANLAVALLSLEDDEARLLELLARARTPLGRPLYDAKHALRLAKERGRRHACVKLLCELGLHEDAVALALDVDLELAKAVAGGAPDDDDGGGGLRRKLWLRVAKHVVQGGGKAGGDGTGANGGSNGADAAAEQAARIKLAVEFLGEAGGLLRIEDVLPFFPDFVTIDAFRGAITDSLSRHNAAIEALKREMDEATAIADAVRRDLRLLSSRAAVVGGREACAACGRGILDPPPNAAALPSGGAVPPFYVFPTGQAFHCLCAAAEVCRYGGEARAARVRKLLGKLARLEPLPPPAAPPPPQAPATPAAAAPAARPAPGGGGDAPLPAGAAALAARLEEEVGAEDPWNGELLVRMVDLPFVDAGRDAAEVAAWRI